MKNWDLWQAVLVAARAGSLNAAANQLGINATTLSRKIKRLETITGQPLFQRQGVTLKPTQTCLLLLPNLEQAASRLAEIEDTFQDKNARLPRKLAISSVPFIINHVLAPALASLLKDHSIQVELMAQTGNIHLTRREADIAIRLARPDQSQIHAEKISTLQYHPVFKTGTDRDSLQWATLGPQFAHLPESKWTMKQPGAKTALHQADQAQTLLEMVKSGTSKALLPDVITRREKNLSYLSTQNPITRPVWLLTHKDDIGNAHIERTSKWIKQSFADAQ